MDDLGREDVWIVDPGLGDRNRDRRTCHVGVEIKVVKVEMNGDVRSKRKGRMMGRWVQLRCCNTVLLWRRILCSSYDVPNGVTMEVCWWTV